MNCFADDTGLEIEPLENRPGVYSARYAGEQCSAEDNIKKVLLELKGKSSRKANFKTVIALILNGQIHFFNGMIEGDILIEKTGKEGFGYDPIFKPNGFDSSFAEMSIEQKNQISHRGIAVRKLIEFFNQKI